MYRTLMLALAASVGLSAPGSASIVNFEYSIAPQMTAVGTPTMYQYSMRFFIDMDALEASGDADTFGVFDFKVNIGESASSAPPPPFGRGFVNSVQDGWQSQEVVGGANFDQINLLAGGFWKPTATDNEVNIVGFSEVLGDMTWNYLARTDIGDFRTILSGTPDDPFGRLTSAPTDPYIDNDTPDMDTPEPIPLPAGFPLMAAALGGLLVARRRRKA